MVKLDVKLSVIFGLSLFGTLSVISAIGLVTVGIYAILEEGIVLSIKTPLWVGGAVFIGGILTIGIALSGKISYLKSLILIVISGASFLLCFASMLLLEFAEKESIFQPARHDHTGPVSMETRWRSTYVIYLVYLISSVVGMVSAVVGFLYIYCLLIAPVRNQQWKSYQTQTEAKNQDQALDQIEAKNQDQAPEHHAKTKYKFKHTPSSKDSGDKVSMKSRGHGSDLPETSWIYDSQSIHSLVATPTRAFPTEKETQLKKDVVDELRHTPSYKVHRYQTRPPPSPVPPPLPPINPSALTPHPTPPEQVKNNVLDDRLPKPCTAKSLEHYPIPRKYSLRGSSKRGSKHGRQHSGTFRQTSPQGHSSTGEGAVNVAMEHHQGLPDVSKQNFGKGHDQGNINEHHNTFNTHTSPESPTDQKFVAPSDEERSLQTPHQNASDLISLKPVPVKRLCSKRNSMHHQSAATLPGYDQVTPDPSNPQQDSVHHEDQCGLPLPPMQYQENGMTHQKPVRHFNNEVSVNKHSGAAQEGYTDTTVHPWEVHQGQGVSTDQKTQPVPSQRAAYAMESVFETEAPQMTQTQVHQLYQSSQDEETKLDAQGQHDLSQHGYIVIQNPSTHCDTSTDPSISSIEQRSDKPVPPPRLSPRPKLQHQSHVEEAIEGPLPVLHRRSSRKVHERIQAVQQMLGMGSSNVDSSDHPVDQSPPVPKDEVDHLQPRLAATKVQLDNLEDLYVTSTRL